MTAFSRSHLLMLGFAVIAPVSVAIACASEPQDPGGGGGDDGGGTAGTGGTAGCTNTQTDIFNCGTCGHVCAMGQFCTAGQCTCQPPYGACGNSCLNLQGDPMNCGTCGNVCPASASFCSNGTCSATCAGTQCGTLCTNTTSDPMNCGACGTACPTGASCSGGACACPAGTVLCGNACMASCGSGGTGGTSGTGGTTGGGTTGGSAGSGVGGQGGSGGMVVQKLCATKVVPAAPLLTDFETYDGTKPAYGTGSWTFSIGPTATPAYAGLYALSEGTTGETPPAAYTLAMAAGAAASNWAARAVNMATTDWGGGIGMWMGCVNASSFTGLTFQVRGSGPLGTARVALAMEDATPPDAANPAGGGTCTPAPADGCKSPSYEFPITADWTPITIPWAMFMPGAGAAGVAITPTGDEITGLSFGVNIEYVPNPVDGGMPAYVPVPASYEIAIDNLGFTQ